MSGLVGLEGDTRMAEYSLLVSPDKKSLIAMYSAHTQDGSGIAPQPAVSTLPCDFTDGAFHHVALTFDYQNEHQFQAQIDSATPIDMGPLPGVNFIVPVTPA